MIKREVKGVKVTIPQKKLQNYFPPTYTEEEMRKSFIPFWNNGKMERRGKQMQEIQFDYFHGMEAEQVQFLPGSQSIVYGGVL